MVHFLAAVHRVGAHAVTAGDREVSEALFATLAKAKTFEQTRFAAWINGSFIAIEAVDLDIKVITR